MLESPIAEMADQNTSVVSIDHYQNELNLAVHYLQKELRKSMSPFELHLQNLRNKDQQNNNQTAQGSSSGNAVGCWKKQLIRKFQN